MNKVDLSALFHGMQGQMRSQLSTNREFIHHPGSKGDALENTWIEQLRPFGLYQTGTVNGGYR